MQVLHRPCLCSQVQKAHPHLPLEEDMTRDLRATGLLSARLPKGAPHQHKNESRGVRDTSRLHSEGYPVSPVLHHCPPSLKEERDSPLSPTQGILNCTRPDSQVPRQAGCTLYHHLLPGEELPSFQNYSTSQLSQHLRPSLIPQGPSGRLQLPGISRPFQRRKHSWCPDSWPSSRVFDPKWAPSKPTPHLVPGTPHWDIR